ncbi:unnamed protein product, partial [Vitis vinifera]
MAEVFYEIPNDIHGKEGYFEVLAQQNCTIYFKAFVY